MAVKSKASIVTFKKQLGGRIRELRAERGWSQEQLAERAEVHQSFVGPIERAEKVPGLITLLKIAKAFDIAVYELLMLEPDATIQDRNMMELMNLLKSGDPHETKFLISMVREARKNYG